MQRSFRSRNSLAVVLITALLSACGGGSGGDGNTPGATSSTPQSPPETPPSTNTTPSPDQVACRLNGNFTYSGSAAQVAASNGTLAVVVVPSLPVAYQKNRNFTAPAAPASSQVQQTGGAFTTLASSAAADDCLGLDHGKVLDIQGVGSDVAIGRWNAAMDTDGNTYGGSESVHYAVGTPLSLPATSGTLACTQLIADTVGSNEGGITGTVATASAKLDLGTRTLNDLSISMNLDDFGLLKLNSPSYTLTNAQAPLNGASTSGQVSIQSVVVGHDATQPLVALGFSDTLPNAQTIAGVAVLSCK